MNTFFKPTILYKEFMILDLIEKNPEITQRVLSSELGVSVALINGYLDDYAKRGLLRKKKLNSKTVKYLISKKGIEQKKLLNIRYFSESLNVFKKANENLREFLEGIKNKGFRKLMLYGAGEVAEILIQSIMTSSDLDLEVLGVIDDDKNKQGGNLLSSKIIPLDGIKDFIFDGILISSYTNKDKIFEKIVKSNKNDFEIIQFFE